MAAMAHGFGTSADQLGFYDFVQRTPAGAIWQLREEGVVVATGAALSFAATGWIGGITVAESARRRGLGALMTRTAADWLRDHGAQTVLLFATDAGRPVYERLGFVGEGPYAIWTTAVSATATPAQSVARGDVVALDRGATAEDRDVLVPIAPRGWAIRGRGFRLELPFRWSPSIAADPEAGAALLDAAGAVFTGVPAANRAAEEALSARGGVPGARVERMRLGAPVPYRPERIWGVYSLFCG